MNTNKPCYSYQYPRPMVTVDIVLFGCIDGVVSIVLVKRKNDPFKNCWALPGGFVEMDEDLCHAASRELQEETGIEFSELRQVLTIGTPNRDPRGRTISVVYTGLYDGMKQPKADSDAKQAEWISLDALPRLAFDHTDIVIRVAQKWLLLSGHSHRRDVLPPYMIAALERMNTDPCHIEQTL